MNASCNWRPEERQNEHTRPAFQPVAWAGRDVPGAEPGFRAFPHGRQPDERLPAIGCERAAGPGTIGGNRHGRHRPVGGIDSRFLLRAGGADLESRRAGVGRHSGGAGGGHVSRLDQWPSPDETAPAAPLHTDTRNDECRARSGLVMSGGFGISELPAAFRFWGAGAVAYIPVPILVVVLFCVLFHLLLTRTTPGRDIYAIGGNKQAALLSGVPVDPRLNMVYATSGFMSAVAAIVLAGRMNSGFPLAGMGAELDSIAAVIIGGASFFGGVGTVAGTLVGALIIGVLRNGLNLLDVSAYWQTVVIGAVIVVAVWVDVLRQRAARS